MALRSRLSHESPASDPMREIDAEISATWHDAPMAAATSRAAIRSLRAQGATPEQIRHIVRSRTIVID